MSLPAFARLDDRVAVAGQVLPEQVADLAAAGFTGLINNRPDGEQPGAQPMGAEVAAAATASGLTYAHIPFSGGGVTPAQVRDFADALASATGPTLAFCRSGKRSSVIWAAASVYAGAPLDEVVGKAARAGVDVTAEAEFIAMLARAAKAGA